MTIRHVILDRDGVLNREPAEGWVLDPGAWVWEERVPDALARLADAGVAVSVVTNHSVVGGSLADVARVESVHRHMLEDAHRRGGRIDHVLVCPHPPGAGCACGKPRPGLIHEAIRRSGVPPEETLLIGDDLRDLEAGRCAGVRVALVRAGHRAGTEGEPSPRSPVFDDLLEAVETLVGAGPAKGNVTAGDRIRLAFDAHRAALDASDAAVRAALEAVVGAAAASIRGGGKILACGNGGSAATAEHLAAKLVGRVARVRPPIAALALSSSGPLASALSNNTGYDAVFERQIEALARPGDVLLALSTSGRSVNVLRAADAARAVGCVTVAVTGGDGGALAPACHHALVVASGSVTRLQEIHALCLDALAEALEAELFPDAPQIAS